MALPPGPRMPSFFQGLSWWHRPTAFMERCRDRYGKRFTIRLPSQPPFVMISEPDQLKELFTAPPDVLHPGEGARILEPIVGRHSVILLDEAAHLEQRKLMLPAFHGDKMQRLTGLMEELAEREVAGWPVGTPVELHSRFQALTLEIILRAVFGLDSGERLDALRDRLTRSWSSAPPPLRSTRGSGGASSASGRTRSSPARGPRRTSSSTPRSTSAAARASPATTCSRCCSTRATRTAQR